MNLGWLALWATLQFGFVPINSTSPVANMGYVEPGFGATAFHFLTIEGSIKSYFDGASFWRDHASFTPLRDSYSIEVRADPTPWLRFGFKHWCSHAVMMSNSIRWAGDFGAEEVYARLKIGGVQ